MNTEELIRIYFKIKTAEAHTKMILYIAKTCRLYGILITFKSTSTKKDLKLQLTLFILRGLIRLLQFVMYCPLTVRPLTILAGLTDADSCTYAVINLLAGAKANRCCHHLTSLAYRSIHRPINYVGDKSQSGPTEKFCQIAKWRTKYLCY